MDEIDIKSDDDDFNDGSDDDNSINIDFNDESVPVNIDNDKFMEAMMKALGNLIIFSIYSDTHLNLTMHNRN